MMLPFVLELHPLLVNLVSLLAPRPLGPPGRGK